VTVGIVLLVYKERGVDPIVEDQVDLEIEEVGDMEEDGLLDLVRMSVQQVHRLVHVVELKSVAGREIDLGEPAVPDPQL
jgi:hypothetical protein